MKAILSLVAVLPFACVMPASDPGGESCGRAGYLNLLGTNIAAVSLPDDPSIRAFGESDAVTQDFVATRVNLVYDAKGTIIRIYCG